MSKTFRDFIGKKKKDKLLFHNKWVSVLETGDNYIYVSEPDGVAILPFKIDNSELSILIRKEANPLFEEKFIITAITGRRDEGESFIDTAIRELEEEAGYKVDKNRFINVGNFIKGKDNKNKDKMYLVDISDIKKKKPKGDGTSYEAKSNNFWIKADEIYQYIEEVECSYLLSLFAKLLGYFKTKEE